MREVESHLRLCLLSFKVAALYDVVLTEGTCCIDVQPLVYAGTVEMVAAGEFPQLHPIVIGGEADATFLHYGQRTN